MRWVLLICSAITALLIPQLADAQAPMSAYVVPVVVKARGGAGTNWMSDVFVTNSGNTAVKISAHFFPSDQTNTFTGTFSRPNLTIAPYSTLLVTDVIATWFPAAGTNAMGWLFLADTSNVDCSADEQPEVKLVVTSRTYNAANSEATYGQIVEAEWLRANYGPFPSFIPGIRHQGHSAVPGFRTNLGVVNVSTSEITVKITVYRRGGAVAGSFQPTIPALSMRQFGLENSGISILDKNGGFATVELVNSNYDPCADVELFSLGRCDDDGRPQAYAFPSVNAFFTYASNVDNTTGDGENMLPVVDWSRQTTWEGDYREVNCPGKGSPLLKTLRSNGLLGQEGAPTLHRIRE